ncbi:MAG TPA: C40 family peptidase [Streptosporangiales bacterium]
MPPVIGTPARARSALRILVAALALALVAATAPGAAAASPKQDLQAVQRKADALGRKVAVLAEQYDVARIRLAAAQRRSDAVAERVRAQQADVERMRKKISALATSAYMGGPADLAALVSAQSPQDFLDKTSSLELLSEQDRRQIAAFSKASKQLATERAAATRALTAQRKITTHIGHTRTTILSALAKQNKLLTQLKAQAAQRARQQARDRAAQQAQQQANDRTTQRASRDTTRQTTPAPGNLPPVSGKVAKVIDFAQAQLGKPYQWGADGPGSYDCSGLTMASWRQAGVSLPHSSSQQYATGGPHVAKSQLKPGDLVFFYHPISHVGLYVGGGKMIAAPSSGDVVKYADINSSYYSANYSGAVRPG